MKYILLISTILISVIAHAQPAVGSQSPDIVLKDAAGRDLALSSLKGKVVLIDFWASWCGPCRKANKHLVSIYPALKAKGFEVYSISLDDEKNDWQRAVAADKIEWLQVNEKGSWDAPVARQWNINQIPTSYLLDRNGKIVARDLEGRHLEHTINQLLSK